jgi:RND family efflux transporter MFP subunit
MKRIFEWALLLPWSVALGASAAAPPPPPPAVQVETAPLRQQPVTSIVDGYGTVATAEDGRAAVSFLHAGQITQLLVRQGQAVKAGDMLLALTADPSSTLSYAKASAALEFATRELERTKLLVQQHLATNAQLAAAQKAVTDATAALVVERKLGNNRAVERAVAPFDGYVVSLSVAPGDRIQPNTTVLMLARTDRLRVTAGLQPEDAARVQGGMTADVVPVFTPDRPLQGMVQAVNGTINPASKLIDIWVELPDSPQKLVPGTAVSVRVVLEQHVGWVVPRRAVLHDQKGDYIFQVIGTTARRVAVTTGVETDDVTEITGADPGQPVVTRGNYELQDGMTVREGATP